MKLRKVPGASGTLDDARNAASLTQAALGQHTRLGTRLIAQMETSINGRPAKKPGPRLAFLMRGIGGHWRQLVN